MNIETRTCSLPIVMIIFLCMLASPATAQTWTQLLPTGGPPTARINVGASYDPTTNSMIVVGGCAGPNTTVSCPTLNDVWVLANADGTGGTPTWTQLSPTGPLPSPRDSATTVYDPTTNAVILFAGNPVEGISCGAISDLWLLSNANGQAGTPVWTQLSPQGGPPPSRRAHSAVYDSASNRMIVFGGDNVCGTNYNDVWVLENANGTGGTPAWTQLSPTGGPPAGRGAHTAVYDPTANRMILFGGGTSTGLVSDVWVLENANGSGGTPTWIQLSPGGGSPGARAALSAVLDPANNLMTIFGGETNIPPGIVNDAWVLSNANGLGGAPAWTQVMPTGQLPVARRQHGAAFNPSSDRLTIFGGVTATPSCCSALNDAWVLKLHGHQHSIVTIFSNINDSSNLVCCGYAVGTYPGTANVFIDTYPFTVQGASYSLDSVGLLESVANTGTPSGFTLFLYADSGGLPGTVLESWQGIPSTGAIMLETASSVLHPVLKQGQQYWFGVTTTNPRETGIWWINPGLVTSTACDYLNGALLCGNNAVGAFEIIGTPVP